MLRRSPMLRPVAGAWPEQILAVKKIQKYCWPEHYISGRSMAGALKKVAGALKKSGRSISEKGTSEKIT